MRRWQRGGPLIDRLNRLNAAVDRWTGRVLSERWNQPVTRAYPVILFACLAGVLFWLGLSAVPLLFGRPDVSRELLPWVLWIPALAAVQLLVERWRRPRR